MDQNGGRDVDFDDKSGWWCQGDGKCMRNHRKGGLGELTEVQLLLQQKLKKLKK